MKALSGICVALACGIAAPLQGQAPGDGDPGRTALAHEIVVLTDAAQLAVHAMEVALPAQRAANPRIPPIFWDEFLTAAHAKLPELVDSMTVVYARLFTIEELRGIRDFYQSPLGRRLIESLPALTTSMFEIGQRWGARIGADVGADLAKRGIRIGQ